MVLIGKIPILDVKTNLPVSKRKNCEIFRNSKCSKMGPVSILNGAKVIILTMRFNNESSGFNIFADAFSLIPHRWS